MSADVILDAAKDYVVALEANDPEAMIRALGRLQRVAADARRVAVSVLDHRREVAARDALPVVCRLTSD